MARITTADFALLRRVKERQALQKAGRSKNINKIMAKATKIRNKDVEDFFLGKKK